MNETSAVVPVVRRVDGVEALHDGVATLVDKPKGWSSFKVVSLLRRRLGIRKIGHAGTLDPMATGLLICCIGRTATRQIDRFMGLEKEYEGVIRLGETTESFDAESPVVKRRPLGPITDEDIKASFATFTGEIQQVPPMYSAVKVGGKRLYKLARKGVEVERKPRMVSVHSFDFVKRVGADVTCRITCSKGTYIRSLANEAGEALGVGGHLVSLRRTRIGSYHVDEALLTTDIEGTVD